MKIIRKISAILATFLIASALLCACQKDSSEAPMGFKKISDEGVSYELFVPDEWTEDIVSGVTTAYVGGTDKTNISVMSFVVSGSGITTPEEYWTQIYEPDLKNTVGNLEYVGAPEKTTLGGNDATQYIYTCTVGGEAYKYMQIVAIRKGDVYVFTYTATPENYDTHIATITDGILENFRFR